MSDAFEQRLSRLELDNVANKKDIEGLKGVAIQKEHVREMLQPFTKELGDQGKRLDRLTDIAERQLERSEKQDQRMEVQDKKVESILEDFHNSLIAQAEARQIGNILKAWLPLTTAIVLLIATLFGIAVFVYRVAPPGMFGK